MKFLYGLLIAATALIGCTDDADDGAGSKGPETAVETGGKNVFNSEGYKADCIDCSETGANAYIQAGLGDRFLKAGDKWQVAYLLRTDTRVQMQPMQLQQQVKAEVGLIMLDFEVTENGTTMVGSQERATATIKITQGQARGSVAELVVDKEIRADEVTARIDLVLDDLLRPVSVTEYSGERGAFPNGQTRQLDPRETIRSISYAFPYVVPNVHVNATEASLPELPEALAKIAESTRPGYGDKKYLFFDLADRGLESAERVYWARGDLWPYLVETPEATGVLVWQSK